MPPHAPTTAEWLETDGLGGYASATAEGSLTRRYHALWCPAHHQPDDCHVMVNTMEAWITTPTLTAPLSTHYYGAATPHPDGHRHLTHFSPEPWPTWTWTLPDGTTIHAYFFLPHGTGLAALHISSPTSCTLSLRFLCSGRAHHALHSANPNISLTPQHQGTTYTWQLYPGIPPLTLSTNAAYTHAPLWHYQLYYAAEAARGYPAHEDLASSGTFTAELGQEPAVFIFGQSIAPQPPLQHHALLAAAESTRRAAFPSPLHRSARAYLASGPTRRTLIAGYPWFGDWGRDTFIAMRGVCLATGDYDSAHHILLSWADLVQDGLLPNRFPAATAEYNSADAALWFTIVVHEFLTAKPRARRKPLLAAVDAILHAYTAGTSHSIGVDPSDGLLRAGTPSTNLTWMDAQVDGHPITPRHGKPVELQALWLTALHLWSDRMPDTRLLRLGSGQFLQRFWNPTAQCLYDTIDPIDTAIRPNQIFALGGLPHQLIKGEKARQLLHSVTTHLHTPLGLRTLSPEHPHYQPHYAGSPAQRDAAYHQGTVWPWLLGPYTEATLRLAGPSLTRRRHLLIHLLGPLRDHLHTHGLGHLSEIADAAPPHHPAGCPFQAWSLGEYLRLLGPHITDPTWWPAPTPSP